jgi:hypothetical protein
LASTYSIARHTEKKIARSESNFLLNLPIEEHPDLTTYPILSEYMALTIQQRGEIYVNKKNKTHGEG